MKQRVLSFVLAALLLLSALPLSVFAAGATEAAEPAAMTALDETRQLASLYAEGATVVLLGYNAANDGTVTLNGNGTGTWMNLVNGKQYTLNSNNEAITVDGVSTTTGWYVKNRAVGYQMSFVGTTRDKSSLSFTGETPTDLMGHNGTVEIVSARHAMATTATSGNYNYPQLLRGANLHLRQTYTVVSGNYVPYEVQVAYTANGGFADQSSIIRNDG